MPLFFATYLLCLLGGGLAIWTVVQLGRAATLERPRPRRRPTCAGSGAEGAIR